MRVASTNAVLLGLATTALLTGCPTSPGELCDQGACSNADGAAGDGAGDATSDGAALDASNDAPLGNDGGVADGPSDALVDNGDGFDGFTCDTTKTPKDDNCVLLGFLSTGVFVSIATGHTNGAGTAADPLADIAAGIAKAKSSSLKRVYVCGGTYATSLTIDSTNDFGVQIYGGLVCPGAGADAGGNWAWTGAATSVAPTTAGYALTISGLTMGATLIDLEFDSIDAASAGESSVAAFVKNSQSVAFTRSTLRAGAINVPGAAGTTSSNHGNGSAPNGTNISGTTPGGGGAITCLDGATSSTGGTGGMAGAGGTDGSSIPTVGTNNGGLGGTTCTAGTVGANGLSTSAGGGATKSGSLSASGWSTSPGADGHNGNPGQGGGGGGGRNIVGPGGGGGAGGCGGGKGLGGQTGGSSIALLLFNADVAFSSCTIVSQVASAGGKGGDGQAAQSGGTQGLGVCDGGPGGIGAGGSGAGGGAGGISAGIVWSGNAPKIDGTTVTQAATQSGITTGAPGVHGAKGSGAPATSSGAAGQDGTDGVSGAAAAVTQAQ
jgi:hypothetical protein